MLDSPTILDFFFDIFLFGFAILVWVETVELVLYVRIINYPAALPSRPRVFAREEEGIRQLIFVV